MSAPLDSGGFRRQLPVDEPVFGSHAGQLRTGQGARRNAPAKTFAVKMAFFQALRATLENLRRNN